MDFDLKEIGATVLVGAFVFLCIEAALYYFLSVDLTGFFKGRIGFSDEEKASKKSGAAERYAVPPIPFTVFVAISLVIGIVCEDIGMRIAEDRPDVVAAVWRHLPLVDNFGVDIVNYDSKKELRRSEILNSGNQLTELGQELFKLGIANKFCGDAERRGALNDSPNPDDKGSEAEIIGNMKTTSCTNDLYHTAKNRVFLEPAYFEEMKRIDIRRHLAACFALYAMLSLIPMLATFLLSFWNKFFDGDPRDSEPEGDGDARTKASKQAPAGVGETAAVAVAGSASTVAQSKSGELMGENATDLVGRKKNESEVRDRPSSRLLVGQGVGGAFVLFLAWTVLVWFFRREWSTRGNLLVAFAIMALIVWLLHRTRWGLRDRAQRGGQVVELISPLGSRSALFIILTVSLLSVNVFAFWAYTYESSESYKRAYGYYATIIRYEAQKTLYVPGANPFLLRRVDNSSR